MPSVTHAALRSWAIPPVASFALLFTALIYLRGWWLLRRAGFPLLPPWRAWAFFAGLLTLFVALASPMDVFNSFVLTAHMLQHMLLMMVAPPLILLGAPLIPLVRGLPVFAAREFAGPFLNWKLAQRVGNRLTQPVVALLLMGSAMFAWHTPLLYELALRSSAWHQTEHACFLIASLIFWWPVVQPWPSTAQWPRWAMVPYLLVADLQNTILSAILVFSDHVIYPSYVDAPRLFGFSALEDQAAAGAIMWVIGSLAFLIPAMLIAVQCLSRKSQASTPGRLPKRAPWFTFDLPRRRGLSAAAAEAFSFAVLFVAVGAGFALLLAHASDDDDLALLSRQVSDGLAVSVYAPDLQTGSNSVSVLLQDSASSEVLLDGTVTLGVAPDARDSSSPLLHAAESDAANRLIRTAELTFVDAGSYRLQVVARHHPRSADFTVPLRVSVHEGGVAEWWPQLLWPSFGALLWLVYLQRRRYAKHGGLARAAHRNRA